jgi:hypothetical protein
MTISALPPITYPIDKTLFPSQVDSFIPALSVFVTQANATAAALNFASTNDTSATSNTVGTGAKTFTVSASKSFVGGMYLVIADTAAPSTNSMYCQVTSYSGTTLVVNVLSILGSGTKTAWTISQSSAISPSALYAQSNILGTVSQSAGVPTGAIIERGSNANGEYVRYADGTQICFTSEYTTTVGVNTARATPASFAVGQRAYGYATLVPTGGWDFNTHAYFDGTNFYINTGTAGNTVRFVGIGRWF